MAGEWIKMRADLLDDPTVDRLAEALGIDMLTAVGALFCFWSWADKYSVDGRVDGATSRLIDKVSHKPGFCDALVSVGWLEIIDGGIQIPRFDRHNGQSAKERSLKNQRQARWRESKVDGKKDDSPSTQASTSPSTREEKRREEVKTVPKGTDGDAVSSPAVLTKTELWTAGKSLLATQGMPEKQCGSFVGKLVKDYGDGVVIDAVRAAVIARPADAAEYLKATCQHAAGQRQRPDIARITVPGRTSPDPELIRLEMESKNATPMPDHIREHIKRIKGQA